VPIARSKFTHRVYSCVPYTQKKYLRADENSQWTGNTLPKNSTHATNTNATATSPNASKPSSCSDAAHPPDKSPSSWVSHGCSFIIPTAWAEFTIAPLLQVPPASRGEPREAHPLGSPCEQREASRRPTRFTLLAGGTLRRGSSLSLVFVNYGAAIGIISVFAVRFKHSPHPNPPRERGGSRGSSPVHGGGWEGGMLKNQRKDAYQSPSQSL